MDREQLQSTGIGEGVAIPHGALLAARHAARGPAHRPRRGRLRGDRRARGQHHLRRHRAQARHRRAPEDAGARLAAAPQPGLPRTPDRGVRARRTLTISSWPRRGTAREPRIAGSERAAGNARGGGGRGGLSDDDDCRDQPATKETDREADRPAAHRLTRSSAWGFACVAGEAGLDRPLCHPRVQKNGLALVGHYHGVVPTRVQVIGETELSYLDSLTPDARSVAARGFLALGLSCVVVTGGKEPPRALVAAAEATSTPLFSTGARSSRTINALHAVLDDRLAPQTQLHGVLVDVYGVGILLLGKSGIGKSECALELVMRGHRLVADDVVRCDWRPPGLVFGQAGGAPAPPHRDPRARRARHPRALRRHRGPRAEAHRPGRAPLRVGRARGVRSARRGGAPPPDPRHADPRAARPRAVRARHGQHHRDGGAQRAPAARRPPHRARVPRARSRAHLATRPGSADPGRRRSARPRAERKATRDRGRRSRRRRAAPRAPRGSPPRGRAGGTTSDRGRSSAPPAAESPSRPTVVVVSGLSGAGKSQALHALEDLGFFCVDNLPTLLAPQAVALCERGGMTRLALGIDVRVRAFLGRGRQRAAAARGGRAARPARALPRRERRDAASPLQRDAPPAPALDRGAGGSEGALAVLDGVRVERERLAPLRARATRVIDTTNTSVHELRRILVAHFGPASGGAPRMVTRIVSFGFKYGTPGRRRRRPRRAVPRQPLLRARSSSALTGLDAAGGRLRPRGARHPGVPASHARASSSTSFRSYEREGKSYLTIAIGCTGGQAPLGRHRRGAGARQLSASTGAPIGVVHRDIERGQLAAPPERVQAVGRAATTTGRASSSSRASPRRHPRSPQAARARSPLPRAAQSNSGDKP